MLGGPRGSAVTQVGTQCSVELTRRCAAAEVERVTDRFIIVSNGIYGTTCVRAGCMPSKVFIHGAQLYHRRFRGVRERHADSSAADGGSQDHANRLIVERLRSSEPWSAPPSAWLPIGI